MGKQIIIAAAIVLAIGPLAEPSAEAKVRVYKVNSLFGYRDDSDSDANRQRALERRARERLERRRLAVRSVISNAERKLDQGQVIGAYQQFTVALSGARAAGMLDDVVRLGGKVQDAVAEKLALADELYASGQYDEAIRAYRRIATMYHLRTVSAQARRRITEASRDPKRIATLRQRQAAERFDKVMAIVDGKVAANDDPFELAFIAAEVNNNDPNLIRLLALSEEDRAQATRMLRLIAGSYADTPAGAKAKAVLDQLHEAKRTAPTPSAPANPAPSP